MSPKQTFSPWIRTIALVTLLFFCGNNFAIAQIPTAPIQEVIPRQVKSLFDGVKVPQNLGTIQDSYEAPDSKDFVVLIQDAHAILDAQRHVDELIRYFQDDYGVSLVAAEGAQGEFDTTLYRMFPDETVKKKVFSDYLQKGEMTGTEMAAVFGGKEGSKQSAYYGIEDWNLYQEDYMAYLYAAHAQEKVLQKLQAIRSAFDEKRKTIYSKELNELHEKTESFYSEQTSLIEFIQYLSTVIAREQSDRSNPRSQIASPTLGTSARNDKLDEYPNLDALIHSIGRDKEMDHENLDAAIRRLADNFRPHAEKLSKESHRKWNEDYQAFLTNRLDSGTFLKRLVELAKIARQPIQLTQTMEGLLQHTETLTSIRGTKLFDEMEAFIQQKKNEFSPTEDAKQLIQDYQKLRILKNLASLELTRQEWDELSSAVIPELRENVTSECLNRRSGFPLTTCGNDKISFDLLRPALEFYRLALLRDKAFHENFENLLKRKKENSALVILGGFHTQGFKTFLKDHHTSYVVLSPNMNVLEGREHYRELMEGKLSYRGELKTSIYDAFAKHASARFASELTEPDFKRNIKLWRDNIIRTLSKEGRIEEAANYTLYVDRLFKIYQEKFDGDFHQKSRDQILKDIQAELSKFSEKTIADQWSEFELQLKQFSAGLKELIGKKQLDIENVSLLLDRVRGVSTIATFAGAIFTSNILRRDLSEALQTGILPKEFTSIIPASAPEEEPAHVVRSEARNIPQTKVVRNAIFGISTALFGAGSIAHVFDWNTYVINLPLMMGGISGFAATHFVHLKLKQEQQKLAAMAKAVHRVDRLETIISERYKLLVRFFKQVQSSEGKSFLQLKRELTPVTRNLVRYLIALRKLDQTELSSNGNLIVGDVKTYLDWRMKLHAIRNNEILHMLDIVRRWLQEGVISRKARLNGINAADLIDSLEKHFQNIGPKLDVLSQEISQATRSEVQQERKLSLEERERRLGKRVQEIARALSKEDKEKEPLKINLTDALFSADLSSRIEKAVANHQAIELDLKSFLNYDAERYKKYTKYTQLRQAIINFAQIISSRSPAFTLGLEGKYVIGELLKNAFVHGNRLDFNQPIFIYLEMGSYGRVKAFHVFDLKLEGLKELPDREELKFASEDATLYGARKGVEGIEKKSWGYEREDVTDRFSGHEIGTHVIASAPIGTSRSEMRNGKNGETPEVSELNVSNFSKSIKALDLDRDQVMIDTLRKLFKSSEDDALRAYPFTKYIVNGKTKDPLKSLKQSLDGLKTLTEGNAKNVPLLRFYRLVSGASLLESDGWIKGVPRSEIRNKNLARINDLSDAEAHELAKTVLEKLYQARPGRFPLFPNQKPKMVSKGSYDIRGQHISVEYDMAQNGIRVMRIGSLIFVTVQENAVLFKKSSIIQEIKTLKEELGETYENNKNNIIFVTSPAYVPGYEIPVSRFAQPIIASMIAYANEFKDKTVGYFGSGNGILGLVALALGAKKVVMFEKQRGLISESKILLENQGWQENKNGEGDFQIFEADLTSPSFDSLIQQTKLDQTASVALVHIGPWAYLYGDANQKMVEKVSKWSNVSSIFNGGYTVGTDIDNVDHDQAIREIEIYLRENGKFVTERVKGDVDAETQLTVARLKRSELREFLLDHFFEIATFGPFALAAIHLIWREMAAFFWKSVLGLGGWSIDPILYIAEKYHFNFTPPGMTHTPEYDVYQKAEQAFQAYLNSILRFPIPLGHWKIDRISKIKEDHPFKSQAVAFLDKLQNSTANFLTRSKAKQSRSEARSIEDYREEIRKRIEQPIATHSIVKEEADRYVSELEEKINSLPYIKNYFSERHFKHLHYFSYDAEMSADIELNDQAKLQIVSIRTNHEFETILNGFNIFIVNGTVVGYGIYSRSLKAHEVRTGIHILKPFRKSAQFQFSSRQIYEASLRFLNSKFHPLQFATELQDRILATLSDPLENASFWLKSGFYPSDARELTNGYVDRMIHDQKSLTQEEMNNLLASSREEAWIFPMSVSGENPRSEMRSQEEVIDIPSNEHLIPSAIRFLDRFLALANRREQGESAIGYQDLTGNMQYSLMVPDHRQASFNGKLILNTDFHGFNVYESEVPVYIHGMVDHSLRLPDLKSIHAVSIALDSAANRLLKLEVIRKRADQEELVDPTRLLFDANEKILNPEGLILRASIIDGDKIKAMRSEVRAKRQGDSKEIMILQDKKMTLMPGVSAFITFHDYLKENPHTNSEVASMVLQANGRKIFQGFELKKLGSIDELQPEDQMSEFGNYFVSPGNLFVVGPSKKSQKMFAFKMKRFVSTYVQARRNGVPFSYMRRGIVIEVLDAKKVLEGEFSARSEVRSQRLVSQREWNDVSWEKFQTDTQELMAPYTRWVIAVRDFLASKRSEILNSKGEAVRKTRALADLTDEFLKFIYRTAQDRKLDGINRIAFDAVGSYGRREMVPVSDVDARIIVSNEAEMTKPAVEFLKPAIVDILGNPPEIRIAKDPVGLKSGAEKDLQSAAEILTEMLDARFVIGDKTLNKVREDAFRRNLSEQSGDFVKTLINIWNAWYLKRGGLEGLFELEPDIKETLRQMHFASWITKAYLKTQKDFFSDQVISKLFVQKLLTKNELSQGKKAYEFFIKVRYLIAQTSGKLGAIDELSFERQREVAVRMGYKDVEGGLLAEQQLLRDVHRNSRRLFRFSTKLIRRIADESREHLPAYEIPDKDGRQDEKLGVKITKRIGWIFRVESGFQYEADRPQTMLVPMDVAKKINPRNIIPIMQYAVSQNAHLSGELLDQIELAVPSFRSHLELDGNGKFKDANFAADIKGQFKEFFGTQNSISRQLWRMELIGILGPTSREFGLLLSQSIADFTRQYPLDVQALKEVEALEHLIFEDEEAKIFWDQRTREITEKAADTVAKSETLRRAIRSTLLVHTLYDSVPEAQKKEVIERALAGSNQEEIDLVLWLHARNHRIIELMRKNGFRNYEVFRKFIDEEIGRDNYEKWLALLLVTLIPLRLLRPEYYEFYLRKLAPLFTITENMFQNENAFREWFQKEKESRLDYIKKQLGPLLDQKNEIVVKMRLLNEKTGAAEIIIKLSKDQPGILSRIAGVLSLLGFDIKLVDVGHLQEGGEPFNQITVVHDDLIRPKTILRLVDMPDEKWAKEKEKLIQRYEASMEVSKPLGMADEIFAQWKREKRDEYEKSLVRTKEEQPVELTDDLWKKRLEFILVDFENALSRALKAVLQQDDLRQNKSVQDLFKERRIPYESRQTNPFFRDQIQTKITPESGPGITWEEVRTLEREKLLLHFVTRIFEKLKINAGEFGSIDMRGDSARRGFQAVDTFDLTYKGAPLSQKMREGVERVLNYLLMQPVINEEVFQESLKRMNPQFGISRSEVRQGGFAVKDLREGESVEEALTRQWKDLGLLQLYENKARNISSDDIALQFENAHREDNVDSYLPPKELVRTFPDKNYYYGSGQDFINVVLYAHGRPVQVRNSDGHLSDVRISAKTLDHHKISNLYLMAPMGLDSHAFLLLLHWFRNQGFESVQLEKGSGTPNPIPLYKEFATKGILKNRTEWDLFLGWIAPFIEKIANVFPFIFGRFKHISSSVNRNQIDVFNRVTFDLRHMDFDVNKLRSETRNSGQLNSFSLERLREQQKMLTKIEHEKMKRGSGGAFPHFIAASDLHGNVERMKQIIRVMEEEKIERIYLVGDIYAGEKGWAMYELIKPYVESGKIVPLWGNHELAFVRGMLGDDSSLNLFLKLSGGHAMIAWLNELLLAAGEPTIDLRDNGNGSFYSRIRHHPDLKSMAEWIQKTHKIFAVDVYGTGYVHAFPQIDKNGQLITRFEHVQGLEALAKMEQSLRDAKDPNAYVFHKLLQPRDSSPLWANFSVGSFQRNADKQFDKAYRPSGIRQILHGHIHQSEPKNVGNLNREYNIAVDFDKGLGGYAIIGPEGIRFRKFVHGENEPQESNLVHPRKESTPTQTFLEDTADYLLDEIIKAENSFFQSASLHSRSAENEFEYLEKLRREGADWVNQVYAKIYESIKNPWIQKKMFGISIETSDPEAFKSYIRALHGKIREAKSYSRDVRYQEGYQKIRILIESLLEVLREMPRRELDLLEIPMRGTNPRTNLTELYKQILELDDPDLSEFTIENLGSIEKPSSEVMYLIQKAFSDVAKRVRLKAAEALVSKGEFGYPYAASLLKQQDKWVRFLAYWTIARIGEQSEHLRQQAIKDIEAALKNEKDWLIRSTASELLRKLGIETNISNIEIPDLTNEIIQKLQGIVDSEKEPYRKMLKIYFITSTASPFSRHQGLIGLHLGKLTVYVSHKDYFPPHYLFYQSSIKDEPGVFVGWRDAWVQSEQPDQQDGPIVIEERDPSKINLNQPGTVVLYDYRTSQGVVRLPTNIQFQEQSEDEVRRFFLQYWNEGRFNEAEKALLARLHAVNVAKIFFGLPSEIFVNESEWDLLKNLSSKNYLSKNQKHKPFIQVRDIKSLSDTVFVGLRWMGHRNNIVAVHLRPESRDQAKKAAELMAVRTQPGKRILAEVSPGVFQMIPQEEYLRNVKFHGFQDFDEWAKSLVGKKFLDVGAGHGYLMQALRERGVEQVEGIDADEHSVNQARQAGLNVRLGDARHLPYSDESFDVAYSRRLVASENNRTKGPISNPEDVKLVFQESFRVLKPGGRLYFENNFSKEEREQLALQHGFQIISDPLIQNDRLIVFRKAVHSLMDRKIVYVGIHPSLNQESDVLLSKLREADLLHPEQIEVTDLTRSRVSQYVKEGLNRLSKNENLEMVLTGAYLNDCCSLAISEILNFSNAHPDQKVTVHLPLDSIYYEDKHGFGSDSPASEKFDYVRNQLFTIQAGHLDAALYYHGNRVASYGNSESKIVFQVWDTAEEMLNGIQNPQKQTDDRSEVRNENETLYEFGAQPGNTLREVVDRFVSADEKNTIRVQVKEGEEWKDKEEKDWDAIVVTPNDININDVHLWNSIRIYFPRSEVRNLNEDQKNKIEAVRPSSEFLPRAEARNISIRAEGPSRIAFYRGEEKLYTLRVRTMSNAGWEDATTSAEKLIAKINELIGDRSIIQVEDLGDNTYALHLVDQHRIIVSQIGAIDSPSRSEARNSFWPEINANEITALNNPEQEIVQRAEEKRSELRIAFHETSGNILKAFDPLKTSDEIRKQAGSQKFWNEFKQTISIPQEILTQMQMVVIDAVNQPAYAEGLSQIETVSVSGNALRMLAADPLVLNRAYQERYGKTLIANVTNPTALVYSVELLKSLSAPSLQKAEDYLRNEAQISKVVLVDAHSELARTIQKGSRATVIQSDSTHPVDHAKLARVLGLEAPGALLILSSEDFINLGKSNFRNQGFMVDRSVAMDPRSLAFVAKIVLSAELLRSELQYSAGNSLPILSKETILSVLGLMEELSGTKAGQEYLGHSA